VSNERVLSLHQRLGGPVVRDVSLRVDGLRAVLESDVLALLARAVVPRLEKRDLPRCPVEVLSMIAVGA